MADEYDPLSLFLQDAPGVVPMPRVNTSPDRRSWLQRTGDRAAQRIIETAKAEAKRKQDPLNALIDALGLLPGGQAAALGADMAAQGKHPWKRDVGREIDQFVEGVGEAARRPGDALEVMASEAPADWLGIGMRGHTRGEKPLGDMLEQFGLALGVAGAAPKPKPRLPDIDVPQRPPPTLVSKPFYDTARQPQHIGPPPSPLPETPGPWFHGGPDGLSSLRAGSGRATDAGALGVGNYLTNSEDVARYYSAGGRTYSAGPQPRKVLEVVGDDKRTAIQRVADELGVSSRPSWDGFRQTSDDFAREFTDAARKQGYDAALWRKGDRAEMSVFDDVPVSPVHRRGDTSRVTPEMLEGVPDAVADEAKAAAARALEAGAGADLRYVGAGGEGFVFSSDGRAFKVPRRGRSLDVEADALRALGGDGAPKLHDYREGVISRDMVEGRPGGWGDEAALRGYYDDIAERLAEHDIGRPEFKGDSFIVAEDGQPSMVDLGYAHRTGRAAIADLTARVDRAQAGASIFDEAMELRQLAATGEAAPAEVRALLRRLEAVNPAEAAGLGLRRDIVHTLRGG